MIIITCIFTFRSKDEVHGAKFRAEITRMTYQHVRGDVILIDVQTVTLVRVELRGLHMETLLTASQRGL